MREIQPIRLSEALAIAELAHLVILASDEHEPEEVIRERYHNLSLALPDNHILRGTMSMHDRPEFWRNISASVANFALREANGEDVSINGAPPEVREVIERELSRRRESINQQSC